MLSAPSGFGRSTGPSGRTNKPAATAKARKSIARIPSSDVCLPLEGFCWGCTFVEDEVDVMRPKWWLTWKAGGDRLVVRARALAEPPLEAEPQYELQPRLDSLTVSHLCVRLKSVVDAGHTQFTITPIKEGSLTILSLKATRSTTNKPDEQIKYIPGRFIRGRASSHAVLKVA